MNTKFTGERALINSNYCYLNSIQDKNWLSLRHEIPNEKNISQANSFLISFTDFVFLNGNYSLAYVQRKQNLIIRKQRDKNILVLEINLLSLTWQICCQKAYEILILLHRDYKYILLSFVNCQWQVMVNFKWYFFVAI